MANIKIVTDSSVQLTSEEIEKNGITVIPLTITIDGKTYVDGEEISRTDFVKKMNEAETLPKTSQPSIGVFQEVFNELTADGSKVIGIFLAKSLSGTIEAARQASDIIGKSDSITLIDSKITDRGEAFQVITAAKDAAEGKDVAQIIEHVKKVEANTKLEMIVVNLQNLIKGGRLGALSGKIATLLNIRIALQMPEGNLTVAKKGRGKKFVKAFDERVLDDIENSKTIIKGVGISYVNTPEQSEELAKKIKAINPEIEVLVRETSPIVATHAGNGAYAIIYYTE